MGDGIDLTPTVIAMATLVHREPLARSVINQMLPQADAMCVCFSGYTKVPDWAERTENLICVADPMNVLHDAGRFLWTKDYKDAYYFMVDDDIDYKPLYIEHMKFYMRQYFGKAVVSLLGRGYQYENKINYPEIVDSTHHGDYVHQRPILGSGVSMFHTKYIQFQDEDYFDCMANSDYMLALKMASLGIPGYVVPRGTCLATPREHECLIGTPSCGRTRKHNPIVKTKRKSMDDRIKWEIYRHKEITNE